VLLLTLSLLLGLSSCAVQLTGGQLVLINAKLVKKQRFHFTTLQGLDVDIIAGLNGLIWVSPHVPRAEDGTPVQQQQQQQQQLAGELLDSAAAVAAAAAVQQGPSKQQREAVVRVAGAIRALAALMLQIYPGSIVEAYQVSVESGVAQLALLLPSVLWVVRCCSMPLRGSCALRMDADAKAG
jgi:exosome complex component RRP4